MTTWLHPSDPRVGEALQEFKDNYGIDISQALLPTYWHVAMVNDKPEICLPAAGMRALALLAPDPTAVWRTEQLISAMRKAYPTKEQS